MKYFFAIAIMIFSFNSFAQVEEIQTCMKSPRTDNTVIVSKDNEVEKTLDIAVLEKGQEPGAYIMNYQSKTPFTGTSLPPAKIKALEQAGITSVNQGYIYSGTVKMDGFKTHAKFYVMTHGYDNLAKAQVLEVVESPIFMSSTVFCK